MDEKQIEELNKAISKLSDEDQAQIAAAGEKLTDKQCEDVEKILSANIGIAYGGPIIKPIPIVDKQRPKIAPLSFYGEPSPHEHFDPKKPTDQKDSETQQ